jgi:hypothetical protein
MSFRLERSDKRAELVEGNGHDLERMKDYRSASYAENRVEMSERTFAKSSATHKWHNNSAPEVIKLRGLYNHNEWNRILVTA